MQQALGQRRWQPIDILLNQAGQRIRSGGGGASGIAVVFGDPKARQLMHQPLGSRQHGGITGGGDKLFKLAGLAGIVIDADGVGDKRDRLAPLGRMADIADKAIFQLPIRQTQFLCLLLDLAGIGLLAPANHYVIVSKRHLCVE
ncbi:hypothetical protein D3C77_139540 [compost metagenome]